jgi:hypothetical protein
MVKLVGEIVELYITKALTTSEAGGIEGAQNFSLGFKLSGLETF